MKEYCDKILKGSIVHGDQLKLPRAQAIYRSATIHPYTEVVSCKRNREDDEIITLRLKRLQIPEELEYDIKITEDVAIICRKADCDLPDVYAIRRDFPLGLPHSNAKVYKHPVSLCVSDVSFGDMRMQFSAYDFICSIRHWLEKNSEGQLHEADRPLEIFMVPDRFCTLLNSFDHLNPYATYEKVTKGTALLDFTDKNRATNYIIFVWADDTIATSMAYAPKTLGELSTLIHTRDKQNLLEWISINCFRVPKAGAMLPILLLVLTGQHRANQVEKEEGLFAITINETASGIVSKRLKLSERHYHEWLSALPLGINGVIRPIDREMNRSINSTNCNLRVLSIVGVGTLGANIIDHFERKGVCERLIIIDHDHFFPHNYGRHILQPHDAMQYKVQAVKNLYSDIRDQHVVPVAKDVLQLSKNERESFLENADLIIDASTSISVERYLAHKTIGKRPRCCTVFLNPKGSELVILMEDKSVRNRLDLLEMDYYHELLKNPELANHLEVTERQRTNSFSCRSESNVMDYDDVGVLASIASREIQRHCMQDDAKVQIWRIAKPEGTVSVVNIPTLKWKILKEIDGVKVYVHEDLIDEMNYEREEKECLETGGCLFGCYDRDRRIIYVIAQEIAPADSHHATAYFDRGIEGIKEKQKEIDQLTYHQVRYLGEWHSHPNARAVPSNLDKKQFELMSNRLLQEDVPFVQMICGKDDLYVNCRM